MQINWHVRFCNPVWWSQIFLAVASPILAYYGLNFRDLTTWKSVFELLINALKNPYIVGLIVINVLNTINDPTTKGLSDSQRAMNYMYPN